MGWTPPWSECDKVDNAKELIYNWIQSFKKQNKETGKKKAGKLQNKTKKRKHKPNIEELGD